MRALSLRSSTSSRVTELRNMWIWLPSSSHRSWVRHLLRSARQPVAPISVQRVALIGSSTARMISRDPRLGRAARQAIAAARTAHALHQAGAAQAGKELLQI